MYVQHVCDACTGTRHVPGLEATCHRHKLLFQAVRAWVHSPHNRLQRQDREALSLLTTVLPAKFGLGCHSLSALHVLLCQTGHVALLAQQMMIRRKYSMQQVSNAWCRRSPPQAMSQAQRSLLAPVEANLLAACLAVHIRTNCYTYSAQWSSAGFRYKRHGNKLLHTACCTACGLHTACGRHNKSLVPAAATKQAHASVHRHSAHWRPADMSQAQFDNCNIQHE
jgi:hypothetical protein